MRNFTFDNMSRIGNDNCDMSQRNIQNGNYSNYMLLLYYLLQKIHYIIKYQKHY